MDIREEQVSRMGYTRISVFNQDAEKVSRVASSSLSLSGLRAFRSGSPLSRQGDASQAKVIQDVASRIERVIPKINHATLVS